MSNTPPTGPQPGVGAWVPDPAGRHQLRWWDGRNHTAVVADSGVRGIDPMPVQPPTATPAPSPAFTRPPLTAASPTAPTWSQVPVAGESPATPFAQPTPAGPAASVDDGGRRKKRVLLLVGGVAFGVVLAVVAATTLFGDQLLGDDGGTGTFEGEVSADELGHHEVSVGPTQVLIATIVPDDDVDVVVGLLVDGDDAATFEDLYGELAGPTDPAAAFDGASAEAAEAAVDASGEGDGAQVVFRSDLGFAGEDEAVLVIAGTDIDGSVVVAPFGDSAGSYTIEIERFDLELDEEEAAEADGAELLEAVIAGEGVPARVINLASDLLEVLEEQPDS